jgi:hypothetical protein
MSELIEGKVARILNSRELVINRGSAHGVKTGMYFAIYEPSAEEVTDPETGEVLGSVLRPKVKVQVSLAANRFCVARTFETRRVNVGGTGIDIAAVIGAPKFETRTQTLRTREATWEKLSESESFVKTGDVARQILDPATDAAVEEAVPEGEPPT